MDNEKFSEIAELVSNIPVSEVIATRIVPESNGEYLCPFHGDNQTGSFKVDDTKQVWRCFSCGMSGKNGQSFVAAYDGIKKGQAILRIASEFGIIEDEKIGNINKKNHLTIIANKQEIKEQQKADEATLHFVYSILKKGLALENKELGPLSEQHREYLHKRNINDENIARNGYFTFPTRKAIYRIIYYLRKRGHDEDILIGVPGFYLNKKTGKMTFAASKGIGIPIYNENKKIIGIQIRYDEVKEGGSRYRWFTSSFTSKYDYMDLGTAQGSPINVCYPKEVNGKTLFITEGHFKADVLANRYNVCALSVQGITNWREIDKVIEKVKTYYIKKTLQYVYIAFDADMAQNLNVGQQAIKLAHYIKEKCEDLSIYFMLWNEDVAKGIDDLLAIDNGEKEIFKVCCADFIRSYNNLLLTLMQIAEITEPSALPMALARKFDNDNEKIRQVIKEMYKEKILDVYKK